MTCNKSIKRKSFCSYTDNNSYVSCYEELFAGSLYQSMEILAHPARGGSK